jgi:hypothetical protein
MRAKEWASCTQVDLMLKRLDPKRYRRQWVLFNCACCRRAWERMPDACRAYVEAAERYGLGTGLKKDLGPLREGVHEAFNNALRLPGTGRAEAAQAAMAVTNTTRYCAWSAAWAAGEARRAAHRRERLAQADLLREVVGNPFRPIAVEPAWLKWNGGAVPKMAQAVLADGRFADLPILADALEEAGCGQAELLAHLRGPGPHARGCWALGLLLGKS